MQCSICKWNTLLLICPILGKPVLGRNSPIDGGCSLPCLTFCSLKQQSTLRGTESSYEGQSYGVLLMVNVNFWQICRTYSLSVFISWCSYYNYLSPDHDSFWVPVEPHCAKYYRNTCLALLFWLLSSRWAIFVYLLPCYSDFFLFNKGDTLNTRERGIGGMIT